MGEVEEGDEILCAPVEQPEERDAADRPGIDDLLATAEIDGGELEEEGESYGEAPNAAE